MQWARKVLVLTAAALASRQAVVLILADKMDENLIMVIAEPRHIPVLSHKSEVTIIFGLDSGDQEVIEQKYSDCLPP